MPTRAEHRRATLLALHEAAISQYETQGPGVTVDAIAEAAGVARRTVFRWVDGKDQLFHIHPILWFDVFNAALEERNDIQETITDRLRLASRAIALHIDDDPKPVRRAFALVAVNPELQGGFSTVFQQWIDRIADEVLSHTGQMDDPDVNFRARIIGAAVMGMVDAVLRQWLFHPERSEFTPLYDRGFDVIRPLIAELDQVL